MSLNVPSDCLMLFTVFLRQHAGHVTISDDTVSMLDLRWFHDLLGVFFTTARTLKDSYYQTGDILFETTWVFRSVRSDCRPPVHHQMDLSCSLREQCCKHILLHFPSKPLLFTGRRPALRPPLCDVSMCSTSSLSSNYSLSSIIKDVFVWWLAGNPTCVSSFSSTFGSAWRIKVPRTRTFTCRWVVHCATWSPVCNRVILCSFDLACSLHKVLKCYEWCNSGKVYKNPSLPQYLSSTRGLDWSYDDTPCSCLSFVLFVEGRW